MNGREGTRATSKVTLTATLAHDGDAEAVSDHLVAELGAVLRRWGIEALDIQSHAEPITTGDTLSAHLPSIGVVPLDDA